MTAKTWNSLRQGQGKAGIWALAQRLSLLLSALTLTACAGQAPLPPSDPDIAYTHRLEVVWNEVRDNRIAAVCARVLLDSGRDAPITVGCHYFDGVRSHVFTPIARSSRELTTLGHEIAHNPNILGRFHDRHGKWVIRRKAGGEPSPE